MNVLETYLAKIAGEYDGDLPGADSRLTELLAKIAENSGGGGGSAESDTGWVTIEGMTDYSDGAVEPVLKGRRIGDHVFYDLTLTVKKTFTIPSGDDYTMHFEMSGDARTEQFPTFIDPYNRKPNAQSSAICEFAVGGQYLQTSSGDRLMKPCTLGISYFHYNNEFYSTLIPTVGYVARIKWDFFVKPGGVDNQFQEV